MQTLLAPRSGQPNSTVREEGYDEKFVFDLSSNPDPKFDAVRNLQSASNHPDDLMRMGFRNAAARCMQALVENDPDTPTKDYATMAEVMCSRGGTYPAILLRCLQTVDAVLRLDPSDQSLIERALACKAEALRLVDEAEKQVGVNTGNDELDQDDKLTVDHLRKEIRPLFLNMGSSSSGRSVRKSGKS